MNKREAARLRKERLAQIDKAVAWRFDEDMSERARAALFRERDRQIRLAQEEYDRNVATRASRETAVREQSVSRFWQHFGQDGRPVAPWQTEVGPHVEDDDEDTGLWSAGEYDYEDFDIDWGGYDYEDTGYDDENA